MALRVCSRDKSREDDGFRVKRGFMVVVVQFAGLNEGAIEEGGGKGPEFLGELLRNGEHE